MNPSLLFKLRPTTPWRSGPDSGARNRVDSVYHSDSLYAAVTAAMLRLGHLDEWLADTATGTNGAAVRFSSCFPFLEETNFVIPPRTIWPPAALAARVRWKSARFVPVGVVAALFAGTLPEEERWSIDGVSECLVPAGVPGPFRTATRWGAAVDRLSGASDRHATACLEFRPGAGLWAVASFADGERQERWSGRVKAALRLLADSGFGGERSCGWGRSEQPEFVDGVLPDLILPRAIPAEPVVEPSAEEPSPEVASLEAEQPPEAPSPVRQSPSPTAHWLLSLFTPSAEDAVEWDKGNYAVVARGGRIESPAAYGELKKQLNMVCEGSVLVAGETLQGAAPDVAPDGFPHPVYRAGFAVSIPIPRQVNP